MLYLKSINCSNLRTYSQVFFKLRNFFSSKHKLYEVKNNSMLIIEDQQQKLPYMAEIQLANGSKGVVMKIQEQGKSYIGMYEQSKYFSKNSNGEIHVAKVAKSWNSSTPDLVKRITSNAQQNRGAFDVNSNLTLKSQTAPSQNNQNNFQLFNGKKRRLKSSSPILNICYDMFYGDMISFMGCRGSKKSQNSWNIAKQFLNTNSTHLAIYINPFFKQVEQFQQICPKAISFTVPQNQKPTDVGVYMLTLKAIHLSNELKKKGMNVLLVVDNLSDIMLREWNLLQSIKFNSKSVDSSKLFQYNTLKISPISILNEIYSNCQDNNSISKQHVNKTNKNISKGSLTSILITERQNNELVQQITSFSNNLKHLQTLSQVIQFPLSFKINTNLYYPRLNCEEELTQAKSEIGFQEKQLYRFLRSYVNKYLNEKKETQLKRQLYKNDLRDAPWDYFFLLDADWWTTGIKELSSSFKSFKEANQFIKWVIFNIEHDYIGHWNLSAKQSYQRFLTFMRNHLNLEETTSSQNIQFSYEDMEIFIDDCKMQGLINPFKKDYLI